MQTIRKSIKLDTIQGLRAAAALLVVFDHAIFTLIARSGFPESYKYFAGALGDSGVFLFFAISGFIMMYTSYANFAVSGSPYRFMLRRILRIVPLYWLCMLIYWFKLVAEHKAPGIGDLIRSFLFMPYVNSDGLMQPVYPLGWTLNYEMFFYALFAIALFFNRVTGVILTIASFTLLVIAGNTMVSDQPLNAIAYFYTRPVILYFIAGMMVFLIWNKFPKQLSFTIPSGSFYLIFLCAAFTFTIVIFHQYALEVSPYFVFFSVFLVLCYSTLGLPTGRWDGQLWKTIKTLGDASFSIYLTHSFILGPLGRVWSMLKISNDFWVAFCLIAMVAASVLGYLTYRFVEKPLISITKRYLPAKRIPSPEPLGQSLN